MNWIRSITYGPLYGGANAGVLSFTVQFNGHDPDMDKSEMAETVIKLRSYGGRKVVNLLGVFPGNDSYMYTFCRALRDSGFKIIAHSKGQIYHSWFTLVDWLVVENSGEPWMVFKCSEVIFTWDGEAAFPEVTPELQTTQFVLRPDALTDPDRQILTALNRAGEAWRLFVEPEHRIIQKVL